MEEVNQSKMDVEAGHVKCLEMNQKVASVVLIKKALRYPQDPYMTHEIIGFSQNPRPQLKSPQNVKKKWPVAQVPAIIGIDGLVRGLGGGQGGAKKHNKGDESRCCGRVVGFFDVSEMS